VALSQDLSEFLIEFSIALHRTSMYPRGHPSLERSAGLMVSRLAVLLLDRSSISIGVARRQLVIEGVATDPKHPVLRSLADKLHRHQLGAVSFERGANADDVMSMVRLVALAPEGQPLGLGPPSTLSQWKNVGLHPLTYEQLQLIEQHQPELDENADRGNATRSAQLWIGLARAALASDHEEPSAESTEPQVLAEAINKHPAARPYDQVIVGYLLQLAQEVKLDSGLGSSAMRRRLSRLISALDDLTLKRLVEMGGEVGQRRKFLLDATEALAADAVVHLVQAAAASTNQSISNSMIRLLTKLSSFAEEGPQLLQIQADHALREQVQRLIENWSLDDPNPDSYTRALVSMAGRGSPFAATTQTHYLPEPMRVIQMALEVDSTGLSFWRAVENVLESNGVSELVRALADTAPDNVTATLLWQHLATSDQMRMLLAQDHVDFQALDLIFDRMDPATLAPVLMQVLMESESRSTRLGVFKRLAAMELPVLEHLIAQGLEDERWYVRRNMLALLNEKGEYTETVSPGRFARHGDPRVRREALLLWMRTPGERDRAVCVALAEKDERSVRAAITEAEKGVPEPAVPLIARRALEPLPSDVRAQLLQLLHGQRHPLALDTLLRSASAGRTLLGRYRLAARSAESLAALRILRETWADHAKAASLLNRARKATDPEIRAAAADPVRAT
jgi:hypothetical protein